MCGAETKLFYAIVEGTKLSVCKHCGKFGKIISPVKTEKIAEKKEEFFVEKPKKEIIQVITKDFAAKIKKKREQMGLRQEDFAKKISEKESLIHNIESGKFEPSIELARKLEKFLHIKLVEEYEEEHKPQISQKSESMTIGDMIKVKRRINNKE